MATFKLILTKTRTYTGYVEANTAQEAVDAVIYPHTKDSDGTITLRLASGDGGYEAVSKSDDEKITSLTDVGENKVYADSEIPIAVKPSGWDE
tara:strand:+ start:2671 stop:2949 length:279 start_codon:yes stop_codon:yes gene_type:complete